MDELLKLIRQHNMSKDDVLAEASCVEDCGEWYHMFLMGYSAEELREAADKM